MVLLPSAGYEFSGGNKFAAFFHTDARTTKGSGEYKICGVLNVQCLTVIREL